MHKLPLAAAYCRIIPSMDRHTCQRCNDPVAALAYRMPYATPEYVSLRVSGDIDFHRMLFLLGHHDRSFASGGILFLDLVRHAIG